MTPTSLLPLAAGDRATSPVLLGFFAVGGLIAMATGLSWAFDVRGMAPVGYLRVLGAALTLAGLVLLFVTYALWHLG
ncbi:MULTISPECIES: hypothetical protein [unclassified Streptomyces]|uniref:hypothetical protein n=1 Tax=unclassified Streptomyces TaxID=2593676 RepID=UPI002E18B3F9|nr:MULTISPECIES: hypothetical protein [unclassified Streptomyces]